LEEGTVLLTLFREHAMVDSIQEARPVLNTILLLRRFSGSFPSSRERH